MNLSLIITVLVGLVILLVLLKLVVLLPMAVAFIFGLIPFALMVAGLVSCIRSSKARNLKILWILIIVLAPFLGPLLWFFWGKKNT